MAKQRSWDALSEPYRRRLERKGVTRQVYESGTSLKAARGHATTPERPEQAFRHPDQYGSYLRRRIQRGRHVPENMVREAPPRRMIGDSIGWAGRDTAYAIVFTRNTGGSANHDTGLMTTIKANPRTGVWDEVETVTYDQADFTRLAREARDHNYVVQVVSVPAMGVTA